MKRLYLAFALLVGISFSQQITMKRPPKSLEKYYPPQSQRMEYLSNMHAMSVAFHGINLNINEGRWDKALEWANQLKKAYEESARMVPEWKDYYKPALADNLVKAVQSKNVDAVIKASRELGQTCSKCHQDNQAVVKLYYHFPRYDNITLEDPVELQNLKTKDYMKKLTDSMKSLRVFLVQGDMAKAREHGDNFVERAKQLNTMCTKCHTSKASIESLAGREYLTALDNLQKALKAPQINRDNVFRHLSEVGQFCYRCHNVHLIPVLVQDALK
ncbi:hypothetical protein IAE16_05275 [Hydrogenobacter sp. T-2]|uniref:hypothetical protein n=1 Tax=Pampinifervens diazotrophicum TaxID=1632018 RepID=UPI002B2615E3|nr:hypothetical protein [Hydrogenobacter sp. T-2]WPM31237.1 hypothetical protein IAE16_05275 [Hydrogenobacter sp. T-2]